MKKFVFRLESLLKFRAYQEERAKMELARAEHDVLECKNSIENAGNELSAAFMELEKETASGIDVAKYKAFANYITGIESFIDSEKKRLKKLQAVVSEKRRKLAKKTVEKKIIENLKAKQKEAYYKDVLKLLEKESDDITIVRKARELINDTNEPQ